MRLPDFLIIGAQKAGSTWLAHRLNQHPDIFIPNRELHYFNNQKNYQKGEKWYASHFDEAEPEQLIGEKTPNYLFGDLQGIAGHDPQVLSHISQTIPNAKLIIVLRDPVERALSAAKHFIRTGRISPFIGLDELLTAESVQPDCYGILQGGFYAHQISTVLEYFPPEQVLILIFEEDVVANPAKALMRVCNFLGIDDSFEFSALDERSNAFASSRLRMVIDYYLPLLRRVTPLLDYFLPKAKMDLSPEARARLIDYYTDENRRLCKMIGREIGCWTSST